MNCHASMDIREGVTATWETPQIDKLLKACYEAAKRTL
jgi:hypothetical protein